jgi:hypothetical protein
MLRAILLTSLTALALGLTLDGSRSQTPEEPPSISDRDHTPGFVEEMDGFRLIQEERAGLPTDVEETR